jgi:hypothetical protein
MPRVQIDGIHEDTDRARRAEAAVAVEPREGPVPAQATVQYHEHYSQPIADDFPACGFSLHVEGIVSGNARNRVGTGDLDTAYFGLDNYECSVQVTNTANGKALGIWARSAGSGRGRPG